MKSSIFEKNTFSWIVIIFITIGLLFFQDKWGWISKYPKEFIIPISDWINFSMEKFINKFGWFFLNISWLLSWPIIGAQWLLYSVPWVVIIFLVTFIAYLSSGLKLALFTLSATFYMILIGYWEESMNTLALVIISVPMAIIIGFGLGALIEFLVIQPIKNAAALSIVATFGLSIILQESVRATYGAAPTRLVPPIDGTVLLFGLEYEIYRLFAAAVSIFAIGLFFGFLHRTKLGTWMRAVRFDPETATAINSPFSETIGPPLFPGFIAISTVI